MSAGSFKYPYESSNGQLPPGVVVDRYIEAFGLADVDMAITDTPANVKLTTKEFHMPNIKI